MREPITIDRDEMAALLNVSAGYVARKTRLLTERYGFPRPLPGISLTWSRALVAAWIETNGRVAIDAVANDDTVPAPPPPPPRHVDIIARQSEALAARYGVAGGAGGAS